MTDEQFDQLLSALKDIASELSSISVNLDRIDDGCSAIANNMSMIGEPPAED